MDSPSEQPNPLPVTKNLNCPYYEGCLDHAVQQGWAAWSCEQCPFRYVKKAPEIQYTGSETAGRLTLGWPVESPLEELEEIVPG